MARAISSGNGSGGLLRIKPLDLILRQSDDGERGLKRTMGVVSLTAFGVAAIIGAGIFVLTGVAASIEAGPGIVLSYVYFLYSRHHSRLETGDPEPAQSA